MLCVLIDHTVCLKFKLNSLVLQSWLSAGMYWKAMVAMVVCRDVLEGHGCHGCLPGCTGRPWLPWLSAGTYWKAMVAMVVCRDVLEGHGCLLGCTGRPFLAI